MSYMIFVAAVMAAVLIGLGGFALGRIGKPSYMQDIVDFHVKFGLHYDGPPRVLPTELANFRISFMSEELDEYQQAEIDMANLVDDKARPLIRKQGKIDQLLELELDALVDLTYVVLGTAYLQFGPAIFAEAWRRVHEANMKKVRKLKATDGHTDSGRAAEYDVVKPAGWVPPSHLDLIQTRHSPYTLDEMTVLQ